MAVGIDAVGFRIRETFPRIPACPILYETGPIKTGDPTVTSAIKKRFAWRQPILRLTPIRVTHARLFS